MYWTGFVISAAVFLYSIFAIVMLIKKEKFRSLLKVVALLYEGVLACGFRLFDILNYPIMLSNFPISNQYWTYMLNMLPSTCSASANLIVAGYAMLIVSPR